ncbi:MAG: family 43 glycosylhydrolase [Lachnospiraceae bacterium]
MKRVRGCLTQICRGVLIHSGIFSISAETLEGLKNAEEITVWTKHESGPQSIHIWAPEIHRIMGKWIIYYSAGDVDDIWEIRPYVLECQGDDPMKDPWKELGMMQAAPEDEFSFHDFSLDATVFENRSSWYYIWEEKTGVGKKISNLYIARMETPNRLETVQVLLTTPDYDWERIGFWGNEGPAEFLCKSRGRRNGSVHLSRKTV